MNELLKLIGIILGVIGLFAIVVSIILWAIITTLDLFNIHITGWQGIALLIVGAVISSFLTGKPMFYYKRGG